MTHEFDLVVVGSGAGGSTVAYKCRAAGWRVAVVDALPFGGTCALRGCDPKKVLVGAAELIDWARRIADKGIVEAPRLDWPALMRFKRGFTDPVPEHREHALREAGVDVFHGRARFMAPDAVTVNQDKLTARHFLLANGARPVPLGIAGEEHLTYSDQFLELDTLPRRVLFVGGGYISFEFAHVAARAGARVQVVHRGARALAGFDPDLVKLLMDKTRTAGLDVHLDTRVTGIERTPDGLAVRVNKKGREERYTTDLVVHGAGRVPDLEDMDLGRGEVVHEKRGVTVNDYLQSVSNARVYAAGDAAATGGLPLTPVAAMESHVAAANLLKGNHAKTDYRAVPTVVFTVPPLAAVGLNENSAQRQGLEFETRYETTGGWYSSRRVAEPHTAFKVLVEKGTGKIFGAHLLGPGAEETINLFAMAIRHELTAADLKKTIYAYPTHASDVSYMV